MGVIQINRLVVRVDRGWEMDSAGGVTQVYAGRRYFVEMLAAEGAAPQQVTGRINVTATVGSP